MAGEVDHRGMIITFAEDNPDVEALQFIRDDPEGIKIKLNEGNGVVNYVYRIQSADLKSSVIIKYGEETMRCIPDERISLERQELEYECLKLMLSIQPGSAPEPYCLDKKHNILAMADMSDWDLLGAQLERRYVDLEAAMDLGRLLGKVHMETSKQNVSEERWEDLNKKFDRPDMKEVMRLWTTDRMYDETDPLNRIDEENLEVYRTHIKEIKRVGLGKKFSEIYNRNVCFVHGDCHYKSVFVKDGSAAIFDFEFAFLGHPAYNVGLVLACYIMTYIFDEQHATDEQLATGPSQEGYKSACLNAIKNIGYMSAEVDISQNEDSKMDFLAAVALNTGCCVFMMAAFGQMELFIEGLDPIDRRNMMAAGFNLMKNYTMVKNVDEFHDLVDNSH